MRRFPTSVIKVGAFAAAAALVAAVLASLVGNLSFTPTHEYAAVFTDALGVAEGDDVRIGGVVVGHVESVELGEGSYAEVTFDVDKSVPVYREATVEIRWADVVGNRYLAIVESAGGSPLAAGSTIPQERTKPALNLTVLFNGFQPLFRSLSPRDVNQLSVEIIQILQGESGNVTTLLRNTAQLASSVADKDAVIGRVVDNLTTVLAAVDERDNRMTQLIVRFRDLMKGIAQEREPIGRSLESMTALLDAGSGLLGELREPLRADVGHLGALAGKLAADRNDLDELLRGLPGKLSNMNRTSSYGSFFNFYQCAADIRIGLLGEVMTLRAPVSNRASEKDTVCAGSGPR